MTEAGLHAQTAPEPELRGLTERGGTTLIVAPSGSHKTRLLIAMLGASVTRGSCLGHQASRRGSALAIVGEDLPGFRQRWFAWRADQHKPWPSPELPLFTWAKPANLFTGDGFPELLAAVNTIEPIVIGIDTFADCSEGANDSSAQDVGVVRQKLKVLAAGGSSVIVTHHTGHDQSRGRGSSALEAMANTVILIAADDKGLTLRCRKQRNGPKFPDLRLSFDAEALVLREAGTAALSPTYRAVLDVLAKLTAASPSGVRFVDWRAGSVKAKVVKARNFGYAKKHLVEGGYVLTEHGLFRPV